ncbi:MAG TPA: acyl-CoA dehydrogenase family protein [Myxococcota bacterium]|nr:acyl-CoA dehydrogenase family protein [Myxococcota bacterium]
MNFDFSEDQKLLQKTARDFLTEHAPLSVNREVLESAKDWNPELWKQTAEMGWQGAAIPESYGGAGFGYLELALIATEIGRSLAPVPFAPSVYLATEALLLAGSDAQKQKWLTALASGRAVGTLALAEGPGFPSPGSLKTSLSGGKVSGKKIGVPAGNVATLAVVVAKSGSGVSLALVDLSGPGVTRTPTESIDPTQSVAEISFQGAPAETLGAEGKGHELLEKLLDRAAVLLAWEQLGGAERAFEMTRDFTLGRYAFGRPIASFQALKHRMADEYVALELAKSNCYWGAWALSESDPELALAAPAARVSASDAFDLTSVEMVQMHGGVGFTWEYDCHLFYRRAKQQGLLIGTATHWREKLVQRLAAKHAA